MSKEITMNLSKKVDNSVVKALDARSNENCVVCFKNVEIYSIGECDHPVCYECSTRMRVLCLQNECPICRQSLSKVVFTTEIRSYRELESISRSEYYNKKYKICFENVQIQKAFYNLLDHPCPKCDNVSFHNFAALRDHVRKEHELFYCDICVDHLKIFSFERKVYSRKELALHRRKGDPDNTSHRGHPLCEYCDERFLDRDELYRHLRREHYFCHFCDADGTNQFYGDYDSLCNHFRTKHYLCEEGECAKEKFTSAFRSEIDLKAHITNIHGKAMGKHQVKQARTLQLEITLGPRNRSHQTNQTLASLRSVSHENGLCGEFVHQTHVKAQPQLKKIDASNEQEFPSLSGNAGAASVLQIQPILTAIQPNITIREMAFGNPGVARTKEDFPALGSSGNKVGNVEEQGINLWKKKIQAKGNSNGSMVLHVSNRPKSLQQQSMNSDTKIQKNEKNFPALSRSFKNSNIYYDFVNTSTYNSSVISAKHRPLVNTYESVMQTNNISKINSIKQDDKNKNKTDSNVPRLTSNDFPALPSLAPTNNQSALKLQKIPSQEKRKIALIVPKKDCTKKYTERKAKQTQNETENMRNHTHINSNKQSNEQRMNSNNITHNNENLYNQNCRNGNPPPGFLSINLNSFGKLTNNFQFTNSQGQTFDASLNSHYIPPPSSEERNKELVEKIKDELSSETFKEFRNISKKFRNNEIDALIYYENCKAFLKDELDNILPELIVLLPDPKKQKELLLAYKRDKFSQSEVKLTACRICDQIVKSEDFEEHDKAHIFDKMKTS